MSQETLEEVVEVVYSAQDVGLTQLLMEKIDGDLSQCSLSWGVLQYFLQQSKRPIAVDVGKIKWDVLNIMEVLQSQKEIHLRGSVVQN